MTATVENGVITLSGSPEEGTTSILINCPIDCCPVHDRHLLLCGNATANSGIVLWLKTTDCSGAISDEVALSQIGQSYIFDDNDPIWDAVDVNEQAEGTAMWGDVIWEQLTIFIPSVVGGSLDGFTLTPKLYPIR